ncbi:TonB-dependent receptor domain protein [Pedobacter sp. BAL39]|uniref:TonB-dependent receptor n=1 Tax=Pedobacter sp. BAL39 TaxID=391596 RepID=UPI000155A0A1|nr:TonB-dependent receptor [Pedobacter sp. BAL39]EDM38774.1 TonB-dependent receptor domain protein [Pedobacter sp. BAL39]
MAKTATKAILNLTKVIQVIALWCMLSTGVQAQTVIISGKVIDKLSKAAIPGAGVSLKGTSIATVTDRDGKFSLKPTGQAPYQVQVSYIGYGSSLQQIIGGMREMIFELEQTAILGQEVVISASRTPERILESPVSIERMGAQGVKELPAPSFYDALVNMKGVEVSTQSLTFKSVNTRGFNSNGNYRFNQYTDGMDNQAPGLNFSVGNIVGVNELDLDNVELLPGASSALYGAGGMNGTMLITSKNPFDHQGVSFQYKNGINHVNDNNSGTQPYRQMDLRLAKAWNDKLAVKATFSFLQAQDWQADNYTNFDRASQTGKSGDRSSDPNYDGINVYGDEVSQNMRNVAQAVVNAGTSAFVQQALGLPSAPTAAQIQAFKSNPAGLNALNGFLGTDARFRPFVFGLATPGLLPDQNVSRTGYDENYLVDYNTESLKASGAIHYKFSPTIESTLQANWGSGTSVYTGADRYSLRNFSIGQYKLELKGRDFMLKGYTTQERSGDSYISSILGSYINEKSKSSTAWFPEYVGNYIGARAGGLADAQAHAMARTSANQGRLEPGTPVFENAKYEIMNTTIAGTDFSKGIYGARFNDKTNMYHYEGMYNLTNALNNVVELQLGSSYRLYQLRSAGTIFNDLNQDINIREYGAFAQLGKRVLKDKLKLTVSGRYDKSKNFDGRFTPRATAVMTVAPNNNIRFSYQTGYRNPTTQDQYIDLSVGGGSQRLIGGLTESLQAYNLYENRPFTEDSYRAYLSSVANGTANPALLQNYNFDAGGVRPETVQAYELGYKGLLGEKFLLDVYGYYNQYKNFIAITNVYQNREGNFIKFGAPVNARGEVTAYGGALGLDYLLAAFTLTGNISYNQIGDLPSDYVNDFNTPKVRYNLGIGNKELIKNVGFNVAYRWQDRFYWRSSFASGEVPAFSTFDAQVNLKIPSVNSMIKIGGTNILNKYYVTSYGNPAIGALYYVSYAFNP